MYDTLLEVTIAATPEKVFAALTERQEIKRWWTTQVVAEAKVGSMLEVTFHVGNDRQFVIGMEPVNLESAHKVEWIPQGTPAWNGTHITWDLVPVAQGTKVLFGQRGFVSTSADGSLPGRDGWAYYLTSLKEYLETGKGNPGGYQINR